jgi:FtsH-binding integral membrane protein
MLFTMIVIATFIHIPALQKFLQANFIILVIAAVINIVTFCVLACSRTVCRTVPMNYIILSIFTITEAYLLTSITLVYPP